MTKRFTVGDRVRLKSSFLHDTGQMVGGEGHKRWNVQECPCKMCVSGEWTAVDDEVSGAFFTPEELAAEPQLRLRHINSGNLELARK